MKLTQNKTFGEQLFETFITSLTNVMQMPNLFAKKRDVRRIKIGKKHTALAIEVAIALNHSIDRLRSIGITDTELKETNDKYSAFTARLSRYVSEQQSGRARVDTWLFYDGTIGATDVFELQETDIGSTETNISVAVWL